MTPSPTRKHKLSRTGVCKGKVAPNRKFLRNMKVSDLGSKPLRRIYRIFLLVRQETRITLIDNLPENNSSPAHPGDEPGVGISLHPTTQTLVSMNVSTNIGRNFLNLIDKHFPSHHKLHIKIFNRNTVKVSYSCMSNVKSIITKHNAHIARKNKAQGKGTVNCSCSKNAICPLQKQCMTKDIVSWGKTREQ